TRLEILTHSDKWRNLRARFRSPRTLRRPVVYKSIGSIMPNKTDSKSSESICQMLIFEINDKSTMSLEKKEGAYANNEQTASQIDSIAAEGMIIAVGSKDEA
uniref:Uncharacterized protein n=1 Tax=Romanomermis culicivorax TaxID=13658 RepID=A0A915IUD0_ROMCU